MTYTHIETVTVGSGGASSIEFTSIPQDGTDLLIKFSGRSTTGANFGRIYFNSDTGSNYSLIRLEGNGGSVSSNTSTEPLAFIMNDTDHTANTFSNSEIYISNYSGNANKTWSENAVNENNATDALQFLSAGEWNDTSAITSVEAVITSGNFVEHTTASLYKITAGGDGTVTTA